MTMDDVTSGFNIGTNITTDPWFNDLVGFSEKELREMLTYYKEQGALPMSVDDAVTMMKPNYDNYCFSRLYVQLGHGALLHEVIDIARSET